MVRRATAALFVLLVAAAPGRAAGADAAAGAAIAARWCASCHAVTAGQEPVVVGVPSFADLAARADDATLSRFLFDPHPTMKGLDLSRTEIAAVVAYIRDQAR